MAMLPFFPVEVEIGMQLQAAVTLKTSNGADSLLNAEFLLLGFIVLFVFK